MKLLATLSVLFMIGGTLGWTIELIYRRIAHGKWINPGFLSGPCLPLYASGLIILYFLCSIDLSFITQPALRWAVLIVVLTAAMTVIEYITGLIFTRVYHVKLWDYSELPGNIDGIICPLFSLIWGVLGALYAVFVHPHISGTLEWFTDNPIYYYFAGMYVGVLLVDVVYSFHLVGKLKQLADEKQLIVKYENFKLSVAKHAESFKEKRNFIFPLHSPAGLREEMEHYLETLREKVAELPEIKPPLGKNSKKTK